MAAPVFVIGSPRSGTSILTWCLGQHANLLPLEESVWMGDFAADVGARYVFGSRRGERSQLGAMGIPRDRFFADIGASIDRMILQHGEVWIRQMAAADCDPADAAFRLRRSEGDTKARWVDGTPEYSLHVCGLLKLFPAAKFVHVVRDVDITVASMLNFHRVDGQQLVLDASAAYAYWWKTVSACLLAEQALGSQVVHRVRHRDLVERPEQALRKIFDFLGESFEPACVEPLVRRINSSSVPADFKIQDGAVDNDLLRKANELSIRMQTPTQMSAPCAAARMQMEAVFDARVVFLAGLDENYASAQQIIARLEQELEQRRQWAAVLDAEVVARSARVVELQAELRKATGWALHLSSVLQKYGVLLLVQFAALALTAALVGPAKLVRLSPVFGICFGLSFLGASVHVWISRDKWRRFFDRFRGRSFTARGIDADACEPDRARDRPAINSFTTSPTDSRPQ